MNYTLSPFSTRSVRFGLVLLFTLLLHIVPKSQNAIIDSLKIELENHPTRDSLRVRLLNDLNWELIFVDINQTDAYVEELELLADSLQLKNNLAEVIYFKASVAEEQANFDKAIEYGSEAVEIYTAINNKKGASYTLNTMGIAYYKKGEFENAIDYFSKSLQIDKELNDTFAVATGLNNIGNIYADIGDYDEAITMYLESMEMHKSINNYEGISSESQNLGIVYTEQNNFPLALDYFNRALIIYDSLNINEGSTNLLANVASVYVLQEKYDEALNYFQQSLEINTKQSNKMGIATALMGMGAIHKEQLHFEKALPLFYEALEITENIEFGFGISSSLDHIAFTLLQLGEAEKAIIHYNRALNINKEMGFQLGLCQSNLGLANTHLFQKQYEKALAFALECEKISQESGLVGLQRDALEVLSKIYESTNQYELAYKSHRAYKLLDDSLFNEESIQKLTQIEYDYKFKLQIDSAKLRESKLTKTVELKDQYLEKSKRNSLWAIIAFLATTIVLGGALLLLKLRNVQAETQNIIVEQKLLRSQMTPHFIFNSLSVLQGMILNKEDDKSVSYLSKFSKLLRIILENSRDKTVALEHELSALESYIALQNLEHESHKFTIKVDPSIEISSLNIPPMLIQPFVENAIEHAFSGIKGVKRIDVNITFENKDLICTIKDNGIGIEAQKKGNKPSKKSLSTIITSERLEMLSKEFRLHGSVKIEDRKKYGENGTLVTLVIPYES